GAVPVVGGQTAGRDEGRAPLAQRREITGVRRGVLAGDLAERLDVSRPRGAVEVDDGVRAERRDDPLPEALFGEARVVAQVAAGRVGRGDQLGMEPVEQLPRPEVRLGDPGGDLVVDLVGGLRTRYERDAEHLDQLVLQPVSRRRAPVQLPVRAEGTPDRPRVGLHRPAVRPGYAERLGAYPLGEQHPGDVVVRYDQQLRG